MDADGTFVVVWSAARNDADPAGVFVRRYDASGAPRDAQEFLVNAYTTGGGSQPQVAALAGGGFVVVWTDGHDGKGLGVVGRRFDSAGAAGPEFRVNTYTTGWQSLPTVSADAAGNFVVAWESYGQVYESYGIYAQRYNAAGAPVGPEFRVNEDVKGRDAAPSLAMDTAGNFVVAWDGPYSGRYHIFARRYDTSGTAAPEFRIKSTAFGDLAGASVAAATGGDFVVAWRSSLSNGGTSESVFAHRFDSKGAPLGREFRVHAYTTDAQWNPAVTLDAAGNFVVAWTSRAVDGSHHDVFARVFDRLGEAVGDEFRVNSYTMSQQGACAVVFGAAGGFVTIWQSYGQDGSSDGIFGQRFVADPIFRDGFEAGNVDAWSDAGAGTELTVTAAAGMGGSGLGVAAVVDDTTALFVTDEFPAGEVRYRARFYIDPNGFDPGEAQGRHRTRTFVAFAENPTRRVAAIVLRRLGGAYSLMGRALRDDGTRADTGFFPIADGAHAIEIDLVAATRPDALDGTFELWVDGVSQVQLTGLDNSEGIVDFVRMGALSVKPGAAGTLYFDEFESRRASYIGPLR